MSACSLLPVSDEKKIRGPISGNIVRFPSKASGFGFGKSKPSPKSNGATHSKEEPFFNFGAIPDFTKATICVLFVLNAIVFLFMDASHTYALLYKFGFVPASFTQIEYFHVVAIITPLTSLFFHSDFMHLLFNIIMMLMVGVYVERVLGFTKTMMFFLACGFAGNLLFLVLSPSATYPVVGASGAIYGLMAFTFLHLYSSGKLGPNVLQRGPWPLIAGWAVFIILSGLIFNSISWQSHLGGFFAGIGIFHLWKKGHLKF